MLHDTSKFFRLVEVMDGALLIVSVGVYRTWLIPLQATPLQQNLYLSISAAIRLVVGLNPIHLAMSSQQLDILTHPLATSD